MNKQVKRRYLLSVINQFMDQFRLVLIILGVVLLLGIYFYSRRSLVKPKSRVTRQIPMSGHVDPPDRPYQAALETKPTQKQSRKRLVKFLSSNSNQLSNQHLYNNATNLEPMEVTVYVMPHTGMLFRRDQVVQCMKSLGCVQRNDGTYDYLRLDSGAEDHKVNRLFGIRDVHDPGIFSQGTENSATTNGLLFTWESFPREQRILQQPTACYLP